MNSFLKKEIVIRVYNWKSKWDGKVKKIAENGDSSLESIYMILEYSFH